MEARMNATGRWLRVGTLAMLTLVAAVGDAAAVKAFSDGADFLRSEREYQWGYAAGTLDMLAALQDAGLLTGQVGVEAPRIMACTSP
jgi:hypothetical protein